MSEMQQIITERLGSIEGVGSVQVEHVEYYRVVTALTPGADVDAVSARVYEAETEVRKMFSRSAFDFHVEASNG
jgi:hypothetical protein